MAKNHATGWVGAKIGELRRGRSLSARKLAQNAGVNRQALAKWEADEVSPPLDAVIRLAAALKVPTRVFLPSDPIDLEPPAWLRVARKLALTYDETMRLKAVLTEAGIADTATPQQAVLAWMRERQVL